jgi:hypothetical protein
VSRPADRSAQELKTRASLRRSSQYTWKYIAFLPEHPIVEGPLELTLFFDYLLSSGLVPSGSDLSSIEFGTEVVVGTGTTEVSGFAIEVR